MGTLEETEKENIQATFKASLDSIFEEKLAQEKWQKKLETYKAKVNFIIVADGGDPEDDVYLSLIAGDGKLEVGTEKLEDADFSLSASFEILFNIATGSMNATIALLKGKLKASKAFKNLKKLLVLQKLLVLDKKKKIDN
ncbi:MAG: SCP2 sterol-binding domain-containing protein [Promethearchaeota archaeon]